MKEERKIYCNVYLKTKKGDIIKVSNFGATISKKFQDLVLDLYESKKDKDDLYSVYCKIVDSAEETECNVSVKDIA